MIARTSRRIAALAALVVAVGLVPPARAVFPGANGKIVASTVLECGSESEPDFFSGRTWVAPPGGTAVSLPLRGIAPSELDPALAFSPDGRRLAYTSGSGIMVSRANGSRPRRLTRGYDDSAPAWSPNGAAVAFIRPGDLPGTGLYVVRANGSGRQRLLAQPIAQLAWSPSGDQLAVVTTSLSGPPLILVVGLDGSVREIGPGGAISWSRTGWLAYVRDGGLYVTRVNAPGERLVASYGSSSSYAWSPDGRRIALNRKRLSVIHLNGEKKRQVLFDTGYGAFFSPDGRLVATLSADETEVFVTPAKGGRTRLAFRVPTSVTRRERSYGCSFLVVDGIDWQARPRAR